MGADNSETEAHHIGADSFIVHSFTQMAKDSCHISPNSFRVGISRLISTYGHFSMNAFTILFLKFTFLCNECCKSSRYESVSFLHLEQFNLAAIK